jgi:hypothetical protein
LSQGKYRQKRQHRVSDFCAIANTRLIGACWVSIPLAISDPVHYLSKTPFSGEGFEIFSKSNDPILKRLAMNILEASLLSQLGMRQKSTITLETASLF